MSIPTRDGCGATVSVSRPIDAETTAGQFADQRQPRRRRNGDRTAVVQRFRETAEHVADVAVNTDARALERRDGPGITEAWPVPSRLSSSPVGSRASRPSATPLAALRSALYFARRMNRRTRRGARGRGLSRLSAAIGIDALTVESDAHQRQRGTDVQPIGETEVGRTGSPYPHASAASGSRRRRTAGRCVTCWPWRRGPVAQRAAIDLLKRTHAENRDRQPSWWVPAVSDAFGEGTGRSCRLNGRSRRGVGSRR